MDRHTARHIEKMTGKPVGWMDRPVESDFEPPTSPDSLLVAEPAGRSDTYMPNVIKVPIGTRKVPLVSYVQVGNWTEVVDTYSLGSASDWLLTDLDLSDTSFALEIKGDSMLPDFREGDRIIIDPSVQPNPGDFVVAKNGETEATFKKYRPRGKGESGVEIYELVPLNDDFATLRSDSSPVRIIGTMVEHRRYRKK
ncbi:MAG: SOS response transcriptional repressor [Ferrovum sp.]|nr:SOS response transcriptional repressor [Ferrovum sp.]